MTSDVQDSAPPPFESEIWRASKCYQLKVTVAPIDAVQRASGDWDVRFWLSGTVTTMTDERFRATYVEATLEGVPLK